MNCWKSFYMHTLQQHELLIEEQKIHEPNPLYTLGNVTKQVDTQSLPGIHTSNTSIQVSPS
jgi:hypothetical protein